jgi:DNA invertase Pin-like site-specific DNA recombinase
MMGQYFDSQSKNLCRAASSRESRPFRARMEFGEAQALDKTFTDKAFGKDVKRLQLKAMQSFVREGDTVFCYSMDRLARNRDDLRRIVNRLC